MGKKLKKYLVETPVKNFNGLGPAGIQFAYGKAYVYEGWVLKWFIKHGYKVTEVKDPSTENVVEPTENVEATK